MPVLPDVASRITLPVTSCPDAIPSWIIRSAGRSFTDPPGFCHSAFAYSSTPDSPRSMRRRRMRGVSPTRSTIEGLTPAVNVGIAIRLQGSYCNSIWGSGPWGLARKLMGLIALSNRATRLLRRPPSLDEIRCDAARRHQTYRTVRAARRCPEGRLRRAVHVDRVSATLGQGGGDDLPALRGSVPAGSPAHPRPCDDAHRRRDTRLRVQPAESIVHQGSGGPGARRPARFEGPEETSG